MPRQFARIGARLVPILGQNNLIAVSSERAIAVGVMRSRAGDIRVQDLGGLGRVPYPRMSCATGITRCSPIRTSVCSLLSRDQARRFPADVVGGHNVTAQLAD